MFSFHKPRVYRSTEGCCICRAKSSSSRFTDSRKYESDSMKCFDLKYPRHGEICNACVLLVKRYKRLPVGNNRHWGHVVDARAGPGTKSLSKYKKYREETNDQKKPATNEVRSSSTTTTTAARATQSNKSLSEKFSKIFKKTKKISKPTLAINSSTPRRDSGSKRKTVTAAAHSWGNNTQHSLSTTPESIESDCDEHNSNSTATTTVTADAIIATTAIVQFQTQTRASASRTRNNNNVNTVGVASIRNACHNRVLKRGSKRRKCLAPRKNRRALDGVPFFDENEWKPRKSCCGLVYECEALGGALLVDLAVYTPCGKHQRQKREIVAPQKATNIVVSAPAVVQLTPSTSSVNTSTSNSSSSGNGSATNASPFVTTVVNPTPVLKKHHLFFKRQSESFPHGDAHSYSNNINSSTTVESTANISTAHIVANPNSMASTIVSNNNSSSTGTNNGTTTSVFANNLTIQTVPRHSAAKVATITPIAGGSTTITTGGGIGNNNKSHNFLNRIKADTGKIVKNSWDKLNTAVRLKPSDLQEMKQVNVISAVDKAYVFASAAKVNHVNAIINQPYAHYQNTSAAHQATGNSSPTSTSSSSSSSSTKFSDNSSDSGFDENTLDRKSASPLQEDMERKLLTRPGNGGVQTMFLASGVQIQGQPAQSIMLSGNEVTTKILQNRKQAQNQRNMATAVKITQIVGTATTNGVGVGVGSGGSHGKLRAIYNSNNTIQHENGVTTIVPASSIAASTQTAAMNAAMAPSSVTITPAPSTHMVKKSNLINFVGNHNSSNGGGNNNISNSNINQSNIMNGNNHANTTIANANANATTHLNTITNINSNNNNNNNNNSNSNGNNGSSNSNSNSNGNASCNNVNASLNTQKIILVKTATKYNNNNNNNNPIIKTTTANTTNTALNQLNQNICKN